MNRQATPLGSMSWLMLDRIIGVVLALTVNVWIARHLGPAQYGLIVYASMLLVALTAVGTLGMDQVLARELARAATAHERAAILGTILGLKLAGGALCAVAMAVLAFRVDDPEARTIILLFAPSYLLQSVSVVWLHQQVTYHTRPGLLITKGILLLSSAAKVALILSGAGAVPITAVSLGEAAVVCVAGFAWYRAAEGNLDDWHFDRACARRLAQAGWPLFASVMLTSLLSRVDQAVIAHYLPASALGMYGASAQVANGLLMVPMTLVAALTPYFSTLRDRDRERYARELQALYALTTWFALLAALAATLSGPLLVRLLFGNVFAGAAPALALQLWASVFISQALVRGIWLVAEDLQRYRLSINVACLLLNILLCIALVPPFGIAGAAAATAITQGVGTWLMPMLFAPMRTSTRELIASTHPARLASALRLLLRRRHRHNGD